MTQLVNILNSKRKALAISLFWVLLWVIPWGKLLTVQENLYLAFLADMLRLGVALGIFILPGALLYALLSNADNLTHVGAGVIPIGFALSVFMIGVIGLIGRLAGFPFFLVRDIFALIGLIELILVLFKKPDRVLLTSGLYRSLRNTVLNPPLLLALIIAALLTFHDSLFFIDDTSYSAYLTNWQHSEHLGFNNIIHQANVVENMRFWLAMYPMGQALLSDLSGVPGLLLMGNYLELFLVPAAVLVSYWFGRTLGLSHRAAGFSVLIQVSLYTWMVGAQWPVGTWFYDSLAEDKVSVVFLLAPVFFALVLHFLRKPTWNSRFLVIFSGLGITLTHPVMLFFSCAIAALIVLLAWISKKTRLWHVLEIFIICVGLMLPYAIIRLSDRTGEVSGPYTGEQATTSFQIERYANIVNDIFYGLNPEVLMFADVLTETDMHEAFQFFRILPIILIVLGGIVAFKRVTRGVLYWYVLSSSLLVLFATVPYTGWILGYIVSARLISRIAWFSPLGLAGVLVLKSIIDWLKTRATMDEKRVIAMERKGMLWGLILSFIFVSPFLIFSISQRLPLYFEELKDNKQLAAIGVFIDQNTSDATTIIALDYWDVQLVPAVSAHADLISFREELEYNGHNNFLPLDEIRERIYASNAIRSLDQTVSPEEKCLLIKKYKVQFVVAQTKDVVRFENTLSPCAHTLQIVYRTKELVLIEVK